ncbi:hypothetical protein AMJ52_09025 [candidate division TA06 bacterium DG_78]|uniref:Chloroplast import component protein (Tic20) n=1 Tax=candidate division TA06 bacterium DG_78 TaxID=1703772 RepID=A0A0S7Y9T8_UNCT6|nr:MAG: hypothetical protein AMJ52_09025 [candidate division TA06 bacterium DG_78]
MPEVDKTIEEGKIWAFIGYWGILFLVPLLGKKDNKFAVFHGKQGMILFIAWVVIVWILGFIPIIGWFILRPIGGLLCLALAIIGMVKSLQGEYWKMPVLGDIAEKINI